MDMRKSTTNINAKTAFYFSDGTGRDSYIAINNGGMTASKSKGVVMESSLFFINNIL